MIAFQSPSVNVGRALNPIPLQTNLKVLIYAGTEREKHQDPQSLSDYDVVLASYNVILYDSSLVKRSDVRATFK